MSADTEPVFFLVFRVPPPRHFSYLSRCFYLFWDEFAAFLRNVPPPIPLGCYFIPVHFCFLLSRSSILGLRRLKQSWYLSLRVMDSLVAAFDRARSPTEPPCVGFGGEFLSQSVPFSSLFRGRLNPFFRVRVFSLEVSELDFSPASLRNPSFPPPEVSHLLLGGAPPDPTFGLSGPESPARLLLPYVADNLTYFASTCSFRLSSQGFTQQRLRTQFFPLRNFFFCEVLFLLFRIPSRRIFDI